MKQTSAILGICLAILIVSLLIAGCSDQPADQGAAATPAGTTVPTTAAGPKYSAGDVAGSASTTNQAWLILSYDSATDKYQRAVIYKNADGSWGYRTDSTTEMADRKVVDKVYSTRLAQLTVSSVPVRTPTTPPTTVATSNIPTATTATPVPAPDIKKIIPDSGKTNTTISGVEISGTNFKSGATVMLTKTNNNPINATSVNVASSTLIYCTFVIPDAEVGAWNVVVTNPDGKFDTFSNIFTISSVST